MMGLWYIITWMVPADKRQNHEDALHRWLHRTTQIFPNQKYRYFNQRFLGPGKRVLVFTDLDNLADYEEFLSSLRENEQWSALINEWKTYIDESSIQPLYWEERDGKIEH